MSRAMLLALLMTLLAAPAADGRDSRAERQRKLGPQSVHVDQVLIALEKGEEQALQALVDDPQARGASDPWVIAHEMILRGDWRKAERYAAAGQAPWIRHLAGYVRALGRRSPSVDHWTVFLRALVHHEREEWGELLEVVGELEEEDFDRPDVITIHLRWLQVDAYRALDQREEVVARTRVAAREATSLGWLIAARDLHWMGRDAALILDDYDALARICGGLGELFRAMGKHRSAATNFANQATVQAQIGQLGPAVIGFSVVLEDFDAVLDEQQRIHLLNSLAMGREALGRYAPALRDAGQARVLAEAALAGALAKLKTARDAVPGAASASARKKALAAVREITSLVRQLKLQLPWVYQTLGSILIRIRDFDEAERMLRRSVGLLEALERSGPDSEEVAGYLQETLANLDVLELERVREGDGDLDVAERGLRKRLAFFRREKNARFVEVALTNLAEVLRYRAARSDSRVERSKLLAEASAKLQSVVAQQKSLKDKLGLCNTLRELAEVHRARGELEKALFCLKEARKLANKMSADEQLTQCYAALAEVELERGKPRRALRAAADGVLCVSALFDTLPPGLATLARGRTARIYAAGLRAAVKMRDAEEAFYFLDGARAGALRTGLERIAAVRSAAVDERLLEAEARARHNEADAYRALLQSYEAKDFEASQVANQAFNAARRERMAALQMVQLDSRLESQLRLPEVVSCKEVQAVLAPGEAMVLQGLAGAEAVAVVLTPTDVRLVSLGAGAAIQAACSALRLDDGVGAGSSALVTLRSLVVGPLGLGPEVKRVLFSCQGCLAYQPPALIFPVREVACVSSASAYVGTLSARPAIEGQVLAVGDPVYGAVPDRWGFVSGVGAGGGERQRGGFEPLPNSGPEIESVGDVVLRGRKATETRVVELLGRDEPLRAVHFAVHARADEDTPHFSALALTPSAEDDGLLTALEVYQLKINADLVVLSACESGRGLNAGAEGIVGLTNAFLFAGARRVLVSLWRVDDEASKVLMVEFHRLWNNADHSLRLGAAAALRAAQKYVREYGKTHKDKLGKPVHPEWEKSYYWAAWQLWGAGD